MSCVLLCWTSTCPYCYMLLCWGLGRNCPLLLSVKELPLTWCGEVGWGLVMWSLSTHMWGSGLQSEQQCEFGPLLLLAAMIPCIGRLPQSLLLYVMETAVSLFLFGNTALLDLRNPYDNNHLRSELPDCLFQLT